MAPQFLKDKSGKLIGKITEFDGRLRISNAEGRIIGTYDPKTNFTRNAEGGLVGKGNLLTSLLKLDR